MIKLVSKDKCTGCGACSYICPKGCIEMKENDMHELLPVINAYMCVECGKCVKICPVLNPVETYVPIEAYAARSNDKKEAFNSASGGIASTLYRDGLKENAYIAGAVQNPDFSVNLISGKNIELINQFKNSKYVFSTAYRLYPELATLLKQEKQIIVAGLPCQIAAIRKIFKDNPKLFLIDIVCHGTTPTAYLQQHIKKIEQEMEQSATKMFFRDPYVYTFTFTFTLYNKHGERFYAKRTKDGDTYQFGYHRAISYRESCYYCPFACNKRTGDLSLADYPGLGCIIPFTHEREFINCVLVNTLKGKNWFRKSINKGSILAWERPIDEAIAYNRQLNTHAEKSAYRLMFEKTMRTNGADFEKAMVPLMRKGLLKEKIIRLYMLPKRIVGKVKRVIKNLIK